MVMAAYFLNKREFFSKDGSKSYRVLTVCDCDGQVSEFFHDIKNVPDMELFSPLDLEVSISKYKNSTKVDLLGISYPSV